MYQSLYYSRTSRTYHLRDSVDGWSQFKYKPYGYIEDEDGEYTTIFGKKVNPISGFDWKDPKINESDIDRITRVLVDTYYESDDIPDYQNIVFFDIENEIKGTLTQESIREAEGKITAISLYDNTTKIYYCYVLDNSKKLNKIDNKDKIIIPCKNERELLQLFLDKWEECDPTIISGYNSVFFDVPYLVSRITKVLGRNHACRLSPIREIEEGEFLGEKYTKIAGVNHLDYMLLFKKYVTTQEPSYKLGDIGEKYVNLGKIEYEGSLDKLFNEDVDKFIEYNIRDVEILVKLEEKLKFIDLSVVICHLCHVTYENIYMATVLNEGAILTYLKRNKLVSPNKPTTINPLLSEIKEGYAGGYLLEPVPGVYELVTDADYSSLYPTIIRSLNLGIETYVGRIMERTDQYDCWWGLQDLKEKDPEEFVNIELKNLEVKKVTIRKLINIIENNKFTISPSGAMFRTDIKSVPNEVLTDWFNKRIEYKNSMKAAYKSGDKEKGDFYNRYQHSFKILLNSLYGCFAINSWRYTDGRKILSAAITLCGHRFIQESIREVNKIIDEEFLT